MTDPITVAVLQNRLNAIAEEMGEAMLRTAYSQILNSSRDFSIALIDARCRLVAQADHIPVHVGAMPWAAKALADALSRPRRRGDVYLLNDPYRGGSPPARPHRLRAGVRRRRADVLVGGARASLRYRRRDAWRLQPRRHGNLARGPAHPADAPDRKRRAARGPAGDAGAERAPSARLPRRPRRTDRRRATRRAAPERGDRRVRRSHADRGRSKRCSTPRSVTHAPSSRPGPTAIYDGEAVLDDDGFDRTNIVIRAHVTKQGSDVTVDLSDSDPQVTGFINSSLRQHAIRRGDGLCLPARPRHRQERRRLPSAARRAEGGHHRLGARGRAGDDVHQPLLQRDHRGDHRRPGSRLSRASDGRLGPPPAHRAERHRPAQRPPLHLAHVPGASRRRWFRGGRRLLHHRRVAFRRRNQIRQHRGGGRTLSTVVRNARIPRRGPPATAGIAAATAATCACASRPTARRWRTPPARASCTAPAACWAATTARRTTTRCYAPGASPRKLKSKEVGVVVPPGTVIHVLSGGGGGWGPPDQRDPAAREHDAAEGLTLDGG